MQELFQEVLDNYLLQSGRYVDKTKPLYDTVVNKLPEALEAVVDSDIYHAEGSVGKGELARSPYVALMNRNVANSTQKGLYITYLFKADMSGFYLVFQQGMHFFRKNYPENYNDVIGIVTDYLREILGDTGFTTEPIDLETKHTGSASGYEKTTIYSKFYESNRFDDEMLLGDLRKMLSIYDSALKELGGTLYDDAIRRIVSFEDSGFRKIDDALDTIDSIVKPQEEGKREVRTKLRVVQPKKNTKRRFSRVATPSTDKVDHIKRAKQTAVIGIKGEKLVLEYEQARLEKLGYREEAKEIRWVAKESDGYGYDIQSFDLLDGILRPIHIEVKTTVSREDCEFPVSKAEVDKSKEEPDIYYVYRIYDLNSVHPKLYRIRGAIEDNFRLDPINYLAYYQGPKQ